MNDIADAAGVTHRDLPDLLPSRPLFSSDPNQWQHVVLQRYHHPPSKIAMPPLRDNVMTLQLRGPVQIENQSQFGEVKRRWFETEQLHIDPAGTSFRRTLKGRSDVVLIHIAPALVRDVAEQAYDVDPALPILLPHLAVNDDVLNHIGRLLLAEAEAGAPGSGLMADTLGTALALNMLRRHSNLCSMQPEKTFSLGPGRLRRVIEHMRAHMDERLSLAQLAALGGLSQSQFARAFREATGQPPHNYLIGLRIEKARELLEHTSLPIIEVGMQCGFELPNHFATMFRKTTGMSPRAWRIARRL